MAFFLTYFWWTFDHVFNEVIFDKVITLMETFDEVMVYKFFDVLFGFRRSDFGSCYLFPFFLFKSLRIWNRFYHLHFLTLKFKA